MIDEAWEYYTPDPEIAELMGEDVVVLEEYRGCAVTPPVERRRLLLCRQCGRHFHAPHWRRYCSDECRAGGRVRTGPARKTRTCRGCGKQYWKKFPSVYCSRECFARAQVFRPAPAGCPYCGRPVGKGPGDKKSGPGRKDKRFCCAKHKAYHWHALWRRKKRAEKGRGW